MQARRSRPARQRLRSSGHGRQEVARHRQAPLAGGGRGQTLRAPRERGVSAFPSERAPSSAAAGYGGLRPAGGARVALWRRDGALSSATRRAGTSPSVSARLLRGSSPRAMFEEAPWGEELELPRAQRSPVAGRAGRRVAAPGPSRRRLLATLRRLQSSAPRPPSPSSSGRGSSASDSETEQPPERKRPRKGPQSGSPLGPRAGAPQSQQQQQQQRLPARKEKPAPRADKAAGGGDPEPSSKQRSAGAKDLEEEPRQRLTRRQWKNRQKNKRRQNRFKATAEEPPAAAEEPPKSQEGPAAQEHLSERAASLRLRMEERLESARFRFINQQLYTSSSQQAVQLFQDDPEALAVYHRGFARQVAQWPENPVQHFVRYLRQRPASLVVADFGCGDCMLARSVRNKVHCFDLVALDPQVIVCDMAQVPLDDESVDVAVFCLALMGTNLQEILEEANRVLRVGGTLLVAEVASRFPDVRAFVAALARLGFRLLSKDVTGSHFFTFELRKAEARKRKGRGEGAPPGLALRPCLYKRR